MRLDAAKAPAAGVGLSGQYPSLKLPVEVMCWIDHHACLLSADGRFGQTSAAEAWGLFHNQWVGGRISGTCMRPPALLGM